MKQQSQQRISQDVRCFLKEAEEDDTDSIFRDVYGDNWWKKE